MATKKKTPKKEPDNPSHKHLLIINLHKYKFFEGKWHTAWKCATCGAIKWLAGLFGGTPPPPSAQHSAPKKKD